MGTVVTVLYLEPVTAMVVVVVVAVKHSFYAFHST